jgi:hypothetical protein
MSRRVYIVNNGGHDYSDAERFGELVFCTHSIIRRSDTAQMFRELSVALEDARPDDYLLISSLASLCIVAAGILSSRFGEIHLLIHDGGKYVERDIIFEN